MGCNFPFYMLHLAASVYITSHFVKAFRLTSTDIYWVGLQPTTREIESEEWKLPGFPAPRTDRGKAPCTPHERASVMDELARTRLRICTFKGLQNLALYLAI